MSYRLPSKLRVILHKRKISKEAKYLCIIFDSKSCNCFYTKPFIAFILNTGITIPNKGQTLSDRHFSSDQLIEADSSFALFAHLSLN